MTVYLVGAGPGDPELVSLRGARLLERAEIVVYDRLARPLLELASPAAELVDVGKARGSAPVPQSRINRLLVRYGRRYQWVVRLKGGDPMVFARGGEEAEALSAAGVPFQVVPGISSALAGPTAAGVPLTMRGMARSFTVLTGHDDPAEAPEGYWEALVALGGSIVVLMGTARMAQIADRLVIAGLPAETPVVAVVSATTPDQRVQRTTLGRLGTLQVPSPATFVIGAVAGLDLSAGPGAGDGHQG